MNLTDIIKDIRVYKKGDLCDHPSFDKTFNPFGAIRYISMFEDCSEIVLYCNLYQTIWSKKQLYKFLVDTVPQHRYFRVKYISKTKEKKDTEKNAK